MEHFFALDQRLQSSCFHLINWPLSCVLLKNNADYPWLILVPKRANIHEIVDLSKEDRYQLMDELCQATMVMQAMFKPNKINNGALGNIVSQFHLHVVARFQDDPLWPQGVWQISTSEKPYVNPELLISNLVDKLSSVTF